MNDQERKIFEDAKVYLNTLNLYKTKYINIKINQFSDIPLLTKSDLIIDQQTYPPFGSYINVPYSKLLRIHRTSGTSQSPLLLAITENDARNIQDTGKKLL